MSVFSGPKGIVLLMTFLLGLSGSSAHQENPQNVASSSANGAEVITADPGAKLINSNVIVTTSPAPKPAIPAAPATQAKAGTATSSPAPASGAAGQAWIQETMAKYGVYPEAGTRFVIGPMPAGCYGADGCTMFSYYPDTGVAFDYTITIAPGQLTEYLLFHEIGHARGIRDECGADNFARSVLGPVPGHYC